MGEIAENCQGVKLVLVALKCDLREKHTDEDDEAEDNAQAQGKEAKEFIDYKQGLEVARRIQALRYLGRSRNWQNPAVSGNQANVLTRMLGEAQPRRQ